MSRGTPRARVRDVAETRRTTQPAAAPPHHMPVTLRDAAPGPSPARGLAPPSRPAHDRWPDTRTRTHAAQKYRVADT